MCAGRCPSVRIKRRTPRMKGATVANSQDSELRWGNGRVCRATCDVTHLLRQGKDACQTFPFFFFSIQGCWSNRASTCACRRDHHACAWAAFAAWPASMRRSSPVQRPALVPRVVPGGQKGTGPFQPLRGQDGTLLFLCSYQTQFFVT